VKSDIIMADTLPTCVLSHDTPRMPAMPSRIVTNSQNCTQKGVKPTYVLMNTGIYLMLIPPASIISKLWKSRMPMTGLQKLDPRSSLMRAFSSSSFAFLSSGSKYSRIRVETAVMASPTYTNTWHSQIAQVSPKDN